MVTTKTLTAYESRWRKLTSLVPELPDDPASLVEPLTPDQVIEVIDAMRLEGNAAGTIQQMMAAIRHYHDRAEPKAFTSPTANRDVRDALHAVKTSQLGSQRKAREITRNDMTKMIKALRADESTSGTMKKRDEMALLVGWWGRIERDALCKMEVGDLRVNGDWSFRIRFGRHVDNWKTLERHSDPLDAGAAIKAWERLIPDRGPLVRRVDQWGNVSDQALHGGGISRIVKRAVARVGGDTDAYSGNSLKWGPDVKN